jgi:tryptophanyl-tRNA synthetase
MVHRLTADSMKLIEKMGASPICGMAELPDFYTFNKRLVSSHRDFDKFMRGLDRGEESCIVSGFNPSSTIHFGHLPMIDTNLYFQRKYGMRVIIPITDDESYVASKVATQEEGLLNSLKLAKVLIAYGFDPAKTDIMIDQVYTNIYNLAIRISKHVTLAKMKAYGFDLEQNMGMTFYPAVQAAQVVYPSTIGIPNVLVPVGPDEDVHLRIGREAGEKLGYRPASVIHLRFMPGLDGDPKMSKSKGNAIFLMDTDKVIKAKIMSSFSGGAQTVEEHRATGGIPEVDMAFMYLSTFFLSEGDAKAIGDDYRSGKILSSDLKNELYGRVVEKTAGFQARYAEVTDDQVARSLMRNKEIDLGPLFEKLRV